MTSTARARVRDPAGNLSAEVTSFVGRRREITLTKRLLAESRVVTLTGPGGVGKTRLAIRVAANMRRGFRDKAWFVGLEDLHDPELLADTVSEQLNLSGPSTGDDLTHIVENLRDREMLLVLDNCEQVIEACAHLVDLILRYCPGVRVLATSRQSLGVAGESTMVVPPLQVPDLEHLPPAEAFEQYASVRLFVERAKAALPEFEVDASNGHVLMRLCHHLDGNPLAIELAAVRLRSLSLQQLEERLIQRYELLTEGRRDAPARQQSLRALIDWSYELCTDEDRLGWARISLFSGSFDLEAAEYVAGEGLGPGDVLSAMHSLVDKSVLIREEEAGQVRYRLLQSLREYGQQKLVGSGEQPQVRRRHCQWYAALVSRFSKNWLGPDQVAWMETLHRDQGNLRVALQSAVAETDPIVGLKMATRLGQYWGVRGHNSEARHWLDEALAATPEQAPERPAALRANAWFALLQGDMDIALPMLDKAAVLARQHGNEAELAHIAYTRGMGEVFRGKFAAATELLRSALDSFYALEAPHGQLFSLFGLGLAQSLNGQRDEGLALLKECVELAEQSGELLWRSYALWAVALIEISRDAPEQAESAAKDALRLQRRLGSRLATAFSIDTLAWIAELQGRHERAARLFGAAASVWEAVRAAPAFYASVEADHNEHVTNAKKALGEKGYAEAFERGNQMSHASAIDYALESKRHTRTARDNVHPMPLTKRERQIAELVTEGKTNKEIADSLVIAQRTVEGHVQNILTKLDFTSRAQIAGWVAGQANSPPANSGQ